MSLWLPHPLFLPPSSLALLSFCGDFATAGVYDRTAIFAAVVAMGPGKVPARAGMQ